MRLQNALLLLWRPLNSLEKLAKGQGKRRADMYFATINKTNPSDILKSAYENLVAVNKFDEAFPSLEDYQELQAQAVMGISRDDSLQDRIAAQSQHAMH